jgi:hypothetical protein
VESPQHQAQVDSLEVSVVRCQLSVEEQDIRLHWFA